METMLEPILGNVDTNILWMFIAMMAILIILSIIKKAIKIAVIVGIFAAIAIMIVPMAQDFQSKYHFEMADGAITMQVNGREVTIGKDVCSSIELENKGYEEYELVAVMEDGNINITIPTFMTDGVKEFATRYGIPIEVRD